MADLPEIPGYEILSQLGEGGMSTVYLGLQKKLNRKVAIKILEPSLLKKKRVEDRFMKEAQIAANLHHSNIIQIFDTGKIENYHYTIMEYLDESLKDRMQQCPENKMPADMALKIIRKIMSALDYAHWQGVFHRDIKPDNIMFRQDSTPVLMDFGISLLFDVQDEADRLTKEGIIMGTIHYMSPEQCLSKKDIDGRSDIYSLGVVLYEMLTGKKPFEGDSQLNIAFKHTKEPIPRLPGELSQYQPLIEGMMAKNRNDRISSGAQFMELLEKIEKAPSGSTAPTVELTTDHPRETPQPDPSPRTGLTSSPPETTVPEFAPGKRKEAVFSSPYKPREPVKERLKWFMKTTVEKLKLFINQVKQKLVSFVEKVIKILDPMMNKPIMKKLLLGALPGLVILIILATIIFTPGSPGSRGSNQQSGAGLPFFGELLEQAPQYHQDLKLAREFYQKGDYKSLEEARRKISELKAIVVIPEVEELEMKINNSISLLQRNFNRYYDEAIDYYYKEKNLDKAAESIQKAKEIYTTKELLDLEALIEEEINIRRKK
ncbi:MAG: serine/threonine-protein kinase [Candidatus Aminicenantes bacterium]|jgi:serine/threonine protein kinase